MLAVRTRICKSVYFWCRSHFAKENQIILIKQLHWFPEYMIPVQCIYPPTPWGQQACEGWLPLLFSSPWTSKNSSPLPNIQLIYDSYTTYIYLNRVLWLPQMILDDTRWYYMIPYTTSKAKIFRNIQKNIKSVFILQGSALFQKKLFKKRRSGAQFLFLRPLRPKHWHFLKKQEKTHLCYQGAHFSRKKN